MLGAIAGDIIGCPYEFKTNIIRLAETSAYRCRLEQLKRCWGI